MQASAGKQASGGIQASAFFALFLSLFFFLSVYFTLLFFFTQASPDSARHAFLAMICNDFNIKVVSATSKYTAISKKVVAKSARDNPERDCGWFWVIYSSSKKFKRMAREALEVCLWVLKESNKSRFDSSVGQEQCIDHIPYYLSGLSRAHFFRQPVYGPCIVCLIAGNEIKIWLWKPWKWSCRKLPCLHLIVMINISFDQKEQRFRRFSLSPWKKLLLLDISNKSLKKKAETVHQ